MMQLSAAIATGKAIKKIHDRGESFGLEKYEAAQPGDGGSLGFREDTSGDDEDWNVAELRNLTKVVQYIEPRASTRQAHVEHRRDDGRRVQHLDRALDGLCFDAPVPGPFEESPRRVPDEWLVIEDKHGRHRRWVRL